MWEISGNSLEEPSYLYGTIHLADKRAFEFSDSVLLKLESVDAFAMEVLPNDIMRFMFEEIMNYSPENEQNWKEAIGEERYNNLNTLVTSEIGFSLADISMDYSWALSFLLKSPNHSTPEKGVKATFLDAYLYQLAKVQAKKVLGLEDIEDQLMIQKDVSVEQHVAEIERYMEMESGEKTASKKKTNTLLDIYLSGDLEKIDDYIQKYDSDDFNLAKTHLLERNVKMTNQMEVYLKSYTLFTAVGAAHLAGKGSMIDLLRQKGYTLRPVTAVFSGLAKEYEVKKSTKEMPWETFEIPDVAAQIDLPTMPYHLKLSGMPDFFQSYAYPDLGEGLNYAVVTLAFPIHTDSEAVEQTFVGYPENMVKGKNAKIISQKEITLNDYRGYDITILENNTQYGRYQMFIRDKTIYINGLTSTQKELIEGENAERFLSSFKINAFTASEWKTITSKKGAFKIELPKEVKEVVNPLADEQGNLQAEMHIFECAESTTKTKTTYLISYQDYAPEWRIEDENEIFESVFERISKQIGMETPVKDTIVQGHPSRFSIISDATGKVRLQLIIRGNRVYMLMAVVEGEQNGKENQFFESFELLKEEVSEQQLYKSPSYPVSFLVFHEPKIEDEEISVYQRASSNIDSVKFYYSLDKNTGTNYTTTVYQFTPYTQYQNMDSLMESMLQLSVGADSLVSSKREDISGYSSLEVVTKSPKAHTFKREKTVVKDGYMYEFQTFLPQEQLYSPINNRFFEEISFEKHPKPFDLFSDKSELLLSDLLSEDEKIQELALETLDYYDFEDTSFERLEKAFQKNYPDEKENEYAAKKTLLWQMYDVDSLATFDFIKNHYSEWADTNSCQISAAAILLEMQQPATIDYLKEILIEQTPLVSEAEYYVDGMLANFVFEGDTLQLAERLFPDILQLISNKDYENSVLRLIYAMVVKERLQPQHLAPYEEMLLTHIEATIDNASVVAEEDEGAYLVWEKTPYYITLLEQLENKEKTLSLFQKILQLPSESLQLEVVEVLWKRNESVSTKILEQLAENVRTRERLYSLMEETKKTDLFPANYKNQAALAESNITTYLNYEWDTDESTILPLKPRSYTYKGSKYWVYPYKIQLEKPEHGESATWYLGISGLFPWDKKELSVTSLDFTEINYNELTDDNLEALYAELLEKGEVYEERRLEEEKKE
ncbi:MAG: TraB/GumN family protein [Chitinophagales bacterium]